MPISFKTRFQSVKGYTGKHKILSTLFVIVIVGGGFWMYNKTHAATTPTRYVLGTVQTGTIISIVSGSGQVSPTNQVTINPKGSGAITAVLVKDGQNVAAGQVLAYIDATTQMHTVASAKSDLQNAILSLQKLQEPAAQLSVTQSQDAITKAQESQQSAQTDLSKTYAGGYNDVVSTFLDLPDIQTGLKDIVIGTEAGHGSQWNIDYYENATVNWDRNAITYRGNTYDAYTAAVTAYNKTLIDYQTLSQSSSNAQIEALLNETYATTKATADALNNANSFIQFYENLAKNHDQTPVSQADTSLTSLNTYITKINAHLSTLLADTNQITTDNQAISDAGRTITEDQQSLQKLQAGADPLDVQTSQLSIQQKQNALQQAEDDLANYTIRAPFAGALANFTLHVGDTVSSGTNAGTLITKQDIADLSLNEVDVAKVSVGQKVTLTFDAIPDLSLTGSVVSVSPLGTVTQGVVSYTVKIAFDTQDARVKAGMTVNANIQTAVHQNVLTVPASAVKSQNGSSYVLAFNPPYQGADASSTAGITSNQAPQSIPVSVGISDNANTEIISGLVQGQQIVTRTSSSATTKTTAASATTRGGFGGGGGSGARTLGL